MLTRVGVNEHCGVIADVLGRSEWSAKPDRSAKQTISGGVWICIRVICVIFLSKSKGKMLVQAGIRWYRKGDMLYVPPAESVCGVSVGSH